MIYKAQFRENGSYILYVTITGMECFYIELILL